MIYAFSLQLLLQWTATNRLCHLRWSHDIDQNHVKFFLPTKTHALIKTSYLLFKLHLNSVNVYALADLEYVLSKWRIPNWYLPNPGYKCTPKQCSNDINYSDVEDKNTCTVSWQPWWQYFLWEYKQTESVAEENILCQEVILVCLFGWICEGLIQCPIVAIGC